MYLDKIQLIQGDITKIVVDAIVNAAKESLLGGGGVDGAIHKAAGSGLLDECKRLGNCKIGQAKLTRGHKLPAQYVIHTVGPIWKNNSEHENKTLLWNCYYNSLYLAKRNGIRTIAFPNISTGIYGFPKKEAVKIALDATKRFFRQFSEIKKVMFVCFDNENFNLYYNEIQKRRREEKKRRIRVMIKLIIKTVIFYILIQFILKLKITKNSSKKE